MQKQALFLLDSALPELTKLITWIFSYSGLLDHAG